MIISIFFFRQTKSYVMRISDWSSNVCSSDLSTSLRTSAISFAFRGFRQSLDHKRGSASINEGNRHPQTVGCDRGNRCADIHGHEGRCIVSDDDGKTGHYAGPPLLDWSSCCCRSSERFCTAIDRKIVV